MRAVCVCCHSGALIDCGDGHCLDMFGGVLLLTASQTLLAVMTLPYAIRAILFGLVVLAAVVALRALNP